MDDNVSVEAAIMDFVRFFPEEKRSEFELLLKRCNFHDVTDPGFPIMLFLLYFQEGICDKLESLEEAVRKNTIPQEVASPTPNPLKRVSCKRFLCISAVIAAIAAGVLLWLFLQGGPAVKTAECRRDPPASMREINLYWRRKLAESDRMRNVEKQNMILFYRGLSVSAVLLSALGGLVCGRWSRRRMHRNPARHPSSSQIRALNLYNILFHKIVRRERMPESHPENRIETDAPAESHGETK